MPRTREVISSRAISRAARPEWLPSKAGENSRQTSSGASILRPRSAAAAACRLASVVATVSPVMWVATAASPYPYTPSLVRSRRKTFANSSCCPVAIRNGVTSGARIMAATASSITKDTLSISCPSRESGKSLAEKIEQQHYIYTCHYGGDAPEEGGAEG